MAMLAQAEWLNLALGSSGALVLSIAANLALWKAWTRERAERTREQREYVERIEAIGERLLEVFREGRGDYESQEE